jgi:D-sedoheptulose 7-phosphate isomerase
VAGPLDGRRVVAALEESIDVKRKLAARSVGEISAAAEMLADALAAGGKILVVGNGGSAADAQHVAAELVGRFLSERRALPAIALTTDTSVLTSLLNDYGAEAVFRRQVEALACPGDVLLALSTSGDSPNVLAAVDAARAAGAKTIGLTGEGGGRLANACDIAVRIPSASTPRIQEAHITICHILCEAVERAVTAT